MPALGVHHQYLHLIFYIIPVHILMEKNLGSYPHMGKLDTGVQGPGKIISNDQ